MTKLLYRIRKNDEKNRIIASFSERMVAEKIEKRLGFKTYIEEVLLDDEGKIIKKHKV